MDALDNYKSHSFEQLEKKLLSSLDDLSFRMSHQGGAKDSAIAVADGVATMGQLADRIALLSRLYRARIVKNRFRLAPPTPAVEDIFQDPNKPSAAEIDYASRIKGLLESGKVIHLAEYNKYSGILMRYPKWRRIGDYPAPSRILDFVVSDSEEIGEGRRPPWMPSKTDEEFVLTTLRELTKRGFVLAADADRYEEIMKNHPRFAELYPHRVRGSEARNHIARMNGEALHRALAKGRKS